MSTFVNALRTQDSETENGMVTNSTTLNANLDLFFTIGAIRSEIDTHIGQRRLISKFEAARNEDSLISRKMLFWARDIRGGAGERQAFRVLLRHIAMNHPGDITPNLNLIAEFGRWDDLFCLFGTVLEPQVIDLIIRELKSGNGLLAKWMPRLGGKVPKMKKSIANKVKREMNLTDKEYRKMLVKLTNVVEQKMCSKNYDTIDYSHVPSLAMARYTNAFTRNDSIRFDEFKKLLIVSETKVNAGAIYPYDVLKTLYEGDSDIAVAQWEALPNYMEDNQERVLPVCDVSGSMEVRVGGSNTAMDICISLGLYISERNEGPFKNAFVTFSDNPSLQYLTGDLKSRASQLRSSDWGFSTDLEKTFDFLLDQAIKHNVPESEMPTVLLIMSDMEFDQASNISDTAFTMIQRKYTDSGYTMPKIVFWNLCTRRDNFPATANDQFVNLVSGFSPSILKSVLSGNTISPIEMMLHLLNNERYSIIK